MHRLVQTLQTCSAATWTLHGAYSMHYMRAGSMQTHVLWPWMLLLQSLARTDYSDLSREQ